MELGDFKALFDHISDGIIGLDENSVIVFCNPAAASMLSLDASLVVGQSLDVIPALATALSTSTDGLLPSFKLPSGDMCQPQPVTFSAIPLVLLLQRSAATEPGRKGLADWMRDIVHDLKTPIGAAKNFIDLVKGFGPLNDRQMEQARRAQLTLEGLLARVDQLLDFAWVQSSSELELVETDLKELAQRAIAEQEPYAQRLGIELGLIAPEEGCPLVGNERGLESVINNLVSNAIKYSPDGGQVCVTIQRDERSVEVEVKDPGMGIEPEHLSRIFEPFYRVKNKKTNRIEGSGLGLALVKDIIEKHGGKVFVSSVPGEGSRVGFVLPQDSAHQPPSGAE